MIDLITGFTLFIDLIAELAKLALYASGTWLCVKWIKNN